MKSDFSEHIGLARECSYSRIRSLPQRFRIRVAEMQTFR